MSFREAAVYPSHSSQFCLSWAAVCLGAAPAAPHVIVFGDLSSSMCQPRQVPVSLDVAPWSWAGWVLGCGGAAARGPLRGRAGPLAARTRTWRTARQPARSAATAAQRSETTKTAGRRRRRYDGPCARRPPRSRRRVCAGLRRWMRARLREPVQSGAAQATAGIGRAGLRRDERGRLSSQLHRTADGLQR